MKKRLLVMLLAASMGTALFGCAGGESQVHETAGAADTEDTKEEKENSEPVCLVKAAGRNTEAKAFDASSLSALMKAMNKELIASSLENRVYSPVSIYETLAALALCTQGETRQQILSLLDVSDVNELMDSCDALFSKNHADSESLKILSAASLWMDEGLSDWYESLVVKELGEKGHASLYVGSPADPSYSELFREWVNEQTGGLLSDQFADFNFDPNMVLTLSSTLYMKGAFEKAFTKQADYRDTFTTADGKEEDCLFMTERENGVLYKGDGFSAVKKSMEDGAAVWFFLPDEGKEVSSLFDSEDFLSFVSMEDKESFNEQESASIHLVVPKFDVSLDLSLIDSLKALGVTDVFEEGNADFGGILTEEHKKDAYVSKASHAVRVKLDEEGIEAAAATVVMAVTKGAFMPEEPIDFILDRPFLYVITGGNELPLFVGSINQVSQK